MPKLDVEILNRINFQHSNLWEFYFLDLPPGMKSLSGGGISNTIDVISSSLLNMGLGVSYYKYLLDTVSFNPLSPVSQEFDAATKKNYVSDASEFSEVSMTFKETEDFAVHAFLKSLQRRLYRPDKQSFSTGDPRILGVVTFFKVHSGLTDLGISSFEDAVKNINDFKKNSKYRKALSTGKVFILKGMTLSTAGDYSLSYADSSPVSVSASFKVEEVLSLGLSEFLSNIGLTSFGPARTVASLL